MTSIAKIAGSSTESNAGLQPFNLAHNKGQAPSKDAQAGYPMIVPRYWVNDTPALPENLYTIDCATLPGGLSAVLDSPEESHKLAQRMKDLFRTHGLVLLTNNHDLHNLDRMSEVRQLLFGESMRYSGGSNFRGKLEQNVYDTGAPREAHLHYHEMAYVTRSTKHISFLCTHALEGERAKLGATFVSENIGATQEILGTEFGKKLKDKGLCYVRKLPDLAHFQNKDLNPAIVYNFWQTSFEANDPIEAEKRAREQGLDVTWEDSETFGRYMVTKFYASAFEYCPYTDRNLLYAAIADDALWFDTWPGVRDLPYQDRPLHLLFGDDREMTQEEKQAFVDVYDHHGIPINWKRGDMAFICNYRFAHGRPAFELLPGERRELGVVLGDTFERQGALAGKW